MGTEGWRGGGGGGRWVIHIYRNNHCLYNKIWSDSSEDSVRKELDGDIQCKYKSTERRINK